MRLHPVDVAPGERDGKPCHHCPTYEADSHQQQCPAQNQLQNIAFLSAKCDAQAELACALGYRKRETSTAS